MKPAAYLVLMSLLYGVDYGMRISLDGSVHRGLMIPEDVIFAIGWLGAALLAVAEWRIRRRTTTPKWAIAQAVAIASACVLVWLLFALVYVLGTGVDSL